MIAITKVVLATSIVLIALLGASLIMGFLAHDITGEAIDNLAILYLDELSRNVRNKANGFLLETSNIATKYATAMQFDSTTFNTTEFHRRYLFETMKILPPILRGCLLRDRGKQHVVHKYHSH